MHPVSPSTSGPLRAARISLLLISLITSLFVSVAPPPLAARLAPSLQYLLPASTIANAQSRMTANALDTEMSAATGNSDMLTSSQSRDNSNWAAGSRFTVAALIGCSTSNNDLGGTIFRDFNANGRQDSGEPNFVGGPGPITITAYDDGSAVVAQTLVQTDGSYLLPGIFSTGSNIRLEFSDLPELFQSGPSGTNSGTTVQFHDGASCTADLAINVPCEYCQTNPNLAFSRYESGTGVGDNSGNGSVNMLPDNHSSGQVTVAMLGQVGSIWGLSYDSSSQQLYGAAFLKRHVGLGARGLDGVYVADMSGSSPVLNGGFDLQGVTADNGGTIDLGTVDRSSGANYNLSDTPGNPTIDLDAFGKVGTVGWGGIDLLPDENTLWLVNLNQRTIVRIDLTQVTPSSTNPNTVADSAVLH